MKIKEKIALRNKSADNPLPVIAFIGDSVTQGCFEFYITESGGIDTVFRMHQAYSRLVCDKLTSVYDMAPPVIINAGISGDNAGGIKNRLANDVLVFKPDLTVVSTGLNDCIISEINVYKNNLRKIFTDLQNIGSEVIFLTENIMCTYVSDSIDNDKIKNVALQSMKFQNDGTLEKFFDAAKAVAKECGVKVCDCYKIWKDMYNSGVDTTKLLSNGVNHPTAEMHELFADELVKLILE